MGDHWFDRILRDHRTGAEPTRRGFVGGLLAVLGGLDAPLSGEARPTPEKQTGKGRCKHGRIRCGGTCRDLRSNRAHCGRCNRACAPGQQCTRGTCAGGGGGAAARPFPQNGAADYPGLVNKISHRSLSQQNDDIRTAYNRWKSRYLTRAGTDQNGNELWRVKFAQSGAKAEITVSEGQGYGMVIVATMAGADPDAKTIFDGLWRFVRKNPSCIDNRLMRWHVPVAGDGCDSAFDGDLDIAYSLLLADAQWGSGGAINYKSEFQTVARGIEESMLGPASHFPLLGDWVNPHGSEYNQYTWRTSDVAPGHFAAFARATGRPVWNQVIQACASAIDELQQSSSPNTGLLPDFVEPISANTHTPRPAKPGFLEGATDGDYNYNAGRDPWRLGTAALVNGDASAANQAENMSVWIRQSVSGKPGEIKAGYHLSGVPLANSNYFSSFFAAPFGVAAMVDTESGAQAWLNAVYDRVRVLDEDYFEDSVALLCLLVMTLNFWDPTR